MKNPHGNRKNVQMDDSFKEKRKQEAFSSAADFVWKRQGEYYAFLGQMDRMDLTVLEAELNSGDFRLIYNSNPDYTVKMPEAAFEKFAQFFGNSQIHPEDQERYMQEIEFCHGSFFEQDLRRHSVCSRMYRPTKGEYQLHEFVTLRLETDTDQDKRNVLLLCRPIKAEQPDADVLLGELLESRFLYDILGRTLRCRQDEALTIVGGTNAIWELTGYTAKEIEENFGGCLLELISPKDRARVLRELKEHFAHGNTAEVEFRIATKDQHEAWVLGCCSWVAGEEGENFLYCFLIESTQVRMMLEGEMQRFKELAQRNENIFQIVSEHSDRTLYEYDILTGMTRPWNRKEGERDILSHLYDSNYNPDKVEANQGVIQDSFEDTKKFFSDIHNGVPSGEMKLHIRLENGLPRWYHFRYSSIFDGGRPITALITVEDVTERHEQELVYQRYVQSMEVDAVKQTLSMEVDLTVDKVEEASGRMLELLPPDFQTMNSSYSQLANKLQELGFRHKDGKDGFQYFSRLNLLRAYENGEREIQIEWQIYFSDGSIHWLEAEATLIIDSYNGNLKAAIRVEDVTEVHEKRHLLTQRADYDAMTGLLRRDAGEAQIKNYISAHTEPGGILVVLDLDDLKGVNDTLGHFYGDKALVRVANTLKKHFRKDDITLRFGGDEFVAFLLGAGQNVAAVEMSLVSLLRKLSTITVGQNDEQTIHCSIGCSVEQPGTDTFESLLKRADKALYHVKRSSKNNFAFYTPEMEQADYEYRSKKLLSVPSNQKSAMDQLQSFLSAIASFYQLVLSVNLRDNTYYLMEECPNGVFSKVPSVGNLNEFIRLAANSVHPEDVADYYDHLSREALLQAYQKGLQNVQHHFRFYHDDRYRWIECVVIFYLNAQGDVCDFTLLRLADDKAE